MDKRLKNLSFSRQKKLILKSIHQGRFFSSEKA